MHHICHPAELSSSVTDQRNFAGTFLQTGFLDGTFLRHPYLIDENLHVILRADAAQEQEEDRARPVHRATTEKLQSTT